MIKLKFTNPKSFLSKKPYKLVGSFLGCILDSKVYKCIGGFASHVLGSFNIFFKEKKEQPTNLVVVSASTDKSHCIIPFDNELIDEPHAVVPLTDQFDNSLALLNDEEPISLDKAFENIINKIVDEIKVNAELNNNETDLYKRNVFEEIKDQKLNSNYFYYLTGDSIDLSMVSLAIFEAIGMGVCRNKAQLEETVMRQLGIDCSYFAVDVIDSEGNVEDVGHAICYYPEFNFGEYNGMQLIGKNVFINNHGSFLECDEKGNFRCHGYDKVYYRLRPRDLENIQNYITSYSNDYSHDLKMREAQLSEQPEFDSSIYRELQINIIKNIPKLRNIFEGGKLTYSVYGKNFTLEFENYQIVYKKIESKNQYGEIIADEYAWNDDAKGLVPIRQTKQRDYGLDTTYDILWDERALRTVDISENMANGKKGFYNEAGQLVKLIEDWYGNFSITHYTYDNQNRLIMRNKLMDFTETRAWHSSDGIDEFGPTEIIRYFYDENGRKTHQVYMTFNAEDELIGTDLTVFDDEKLNIHSLKVNTNGTRFRECNNIEPKRYLEIYEGSTEDESLFRRSVGFREGTHEKETKIKDGKVNVNIKKHGEQGGCTVSNDTISSIYKDLFQDDNSMIHFNIVSGDNLKIGTYREAEIDTKGEVKQKLHIESNENICSISVVNGLQTPFGATMYRTSDSIEIEITEIDNSVTKMKQYIFKDSGEWIFDERFTDIANNKRIRTTDYSYGLRSQVTSDFFEQDYVEDTTYLTDAYRQIMLFNGHHVENTETFSADKFAERERKMQYTKQIVDLFYSDIPWVDKVESIRSFVISMCPKDMKFPDFILAEEISKVKPQISDLVIDGIDKIGEFQSMQQALLDIDITIQQLAASDLKMIAIGR